MQVTGEGQPVFPLITCLCKRFGSFCTLLYPTLGCTCGSAQLFHFSVLGPLKIWEAVAECGTVFKDDTLFFCHFWITPRFK